MNKFQVPFLRLDQAYLELKTQIDNAVSRVLNSGSYILGGELERFELDYAEYCSARYAIGVANGLDALYLALVALGVKEGDEVIVPSNTYIATWLAVTRCGAIPVSVPPESHSFNINPAKIENAISKNTKVIIPVHLYGRPADLDPIIAIAKNYGLRVVEDAAQAHGAMYKNTRIGSHGDIVAWSFYPGKNLGALGDGGAITTNSIEIAEKIRKIRNYGSKEKYVHDDYGVNSRLDEVQAAILTEKLKYLDQWNFRRSIIATQYLSEISNDEIRLPETSSDFQSAWHLFVIRSGKRDMLQKKLKKKGVQTLIHYPVPPENQNIYTKYPFRITSKCDNKFGFENEILSLPIGPHLTLEQVKFVIDQVNNI